MSIDNSKKNTQIIVDNNESVPNTVAINDLTQNNSIASSLTTSVPQKDYAPTFDDAACAKTKNIDHEHRMYNNTYTLNVMTSDLSFFSIFLYLLDLKCGDPEFGVNEPAITTENEETDGGYGWLVILGTFMVQITSFGPAACW
jgi:hypothetical protein